MTSISNFTKYLNSINTKIIPLLQQTGAIIAGSSALKYYGNFDFNDTDIDIYITYSHGYVEFNDLYDSLMLEHPEQKHIKLSMSFHTGLPWRPIDDELTESIPVPFFNGIDFVRSCIIDGTKIDFIQLGQMHKNPIDFVNNHFDLDICKCIFTGNEFICNYQYEISNMTCELKTRRLDALILKRQMPDPKQIFEYENIIRKNKYDDVYECDPLNLINRITKYRNRGFTIDTSKFQFSLDELRIYIMVYINEFIKKQVIDIAKVKIANINNGDDGSLVSCRYIKHDQINFVWDTHNFERCYVEHIVSKEKKNKQNNSPHIKIDIAEQQYNWNFSNSNCGLQPDDTFNNVETDDVKDGDALV